MAQSKYIILAHIIVIYKPRFRYSSDIFILTILRRIHSVSEATDLSINKKLKLIIVLHLQNSMCICKFL
jgi:hypothetical protein